MEQYVAALEQTLHKVFSNDSTQISEATKALSTQFFVDANCVPALVHILQTSGDKNIRQLAAVELRKQVTTWWTKLEDAVRTTVKAKLLEIILSEPEALPRHSTARVIAIIGRNEIPNNTWPELVTLLFQCASSQNAGHREVGIYVIYAIFEVTDAFVDNLRQLLELFSRTIVDPESLIVRTTTLQALGKIADFIETHQTAEIQAFTELIPNMVNVLQECLNADDEDSAVKCFDVFDSLLLLEIPVLTKHVQNLIQFYLGIASNKTYQPVYRAQALSFLMWAIVYKKTKIQRLKLSIPMIQTLMPIAAEEEDDSDENSTARLAIKVINVLATNLPPQQVFPVAMEGILAYMQNQDPLFRKAAMITLAVLVEGSVDFIRPKFSDLLLIVCAGLQDPVEVVRRAACMALIAFAEEFDQDVAENHATLLPLVFNLMNEPSAEVTRNACNALDAILEGLGDNILQYMPVLMERLLRMLDNFHNETRGNVVAAIGSAAHASGTEFTPYFGEVMKRLQPLMTINATEEDLALRGITTDALGAIAIAVGKDAFRPYLNDLMNLVMAGLTMDNSRLRECGFYFFSNMSQVFRDEFTPYLAGIVPHLIQSCQLDESAGNSGAANEEDLEDIDADETEDDLAYVFKSAIADEKEIAADTIGELFQHTHSAFLPYVETCVTELVALVQHMSDGVRKASSGALLAFVRTFYSLSKSEPWQAGLPVKVPLHENVANLCGVIMPVIVPILEDEDDKMVVVHVLQELIETVNSCGPGVIAEYVNPLAESLNKIFEKKAYCQQELEDDEGLLDEDEQAEYSALLISNAADLVSAMAATLGETFIPYAKVFIPHVAKYYKKSKPSGERSMAVGCLGEITAGMKGGITEFTETLFELFAKALADEEAEVRSNAAFAVGALCEHTTLDISSQYPNILTALYPLFQNQPLPNVTDNACGAVARMIMRHTDKVPLEQVMPTFVAALPLKRDFEENVPVFSMFFSLIKANNAWVFSNMNALMPCFVHVLTHEDEIKVEQRAELIEILKVLVQQSPALAQQFPELAPILV